MASREWNLRADANSGDPILTLLYRCLLIALAGSIGALARFGISAAVHRLGAGAFPWGTALVNALACLAIGYLWALGEHRLTFSPGARAAVFIGFLGSFSTFSTYMIETVRMIDDRPGWAIANILLQNLGGLLLTLAGYALGRTE